MNHSTVILTPRGWFPNHQLTGGNIPPVQIIIPYDVWVGLGKPGSIDEFHERNARLCTCSPRCPVHG